jgi:hypothetical protein
MESRLSSSRKKKALILFLAILCVIGLLLAVSADIDAGKPYITLPLASIAFLRVVVRKKYKKIRG